MVELESAYVILKENKNNTDFYSIHRGIALFFLRPDGDLTRPLHHDRQEGAGLRRHGGSHLLAGRHRLHQPQEDQRRQERHGRGGTNHAGPAGEAASVLTEGAVM